MASPNYIRPVNAPLLQPPKTAPYLRQYELVEKVQAYDPSADEDLINKAYVFSVRAHGDQTRHSGDPYYAHPIEVAGILAELHADVASICTALLHDVIEDTPTTRDDLADMFGEEIAELVNGVTKLGQVELGPNKSREQGQAENFQKFVLAITRDVRVLLVKLCDRLHNMRTLGFHPKPESRQRIARETMDLYAPLARRIGVDKICAELEDLSFQHLQPDAYESITRRLESWRSDQQAAITQMSIALRELIEDNDIVARVYGREKRPFAIWRKLQRQGISFKDVHDIYAFRILVETVADCYAALGAVHQRFRSVPSRFRDFISVPKPNGYRSLHTTVTGPQNRRVEIQIRTEDMEDVAERGVAAHWRYKDESYAYDPERAATAGGDPLDRLRPLVEMMEHGDPEEFVEHAKMDLFTDQVFTFTPDGDLIALPRGASPIDFAYAVHTQIGDTCIGARINGTERPLRTPLQNGDVVEIIRGGTPEPQSGWEHMVVTGRARSALKRLTREGETEEFKSVGSMVARQAFARNKRTFTEDGLTDALKKLKLKTPDDLYIALGSGKLRLETFLDVAIPGREAISFTDRALIDDENAAMYIKGEGLRSGVGLHFMPCCSPIPGDRIVGLQSETCGVDIHTIDCDVLAAADGTWLDLGWRRSVEQGMATARLRATVQHVPGALADLTRIIGDAGGNLVNILTRSRGVSFFDMIFDIEVTDNRHLLQILAAMRTSPFVVSVERLREVEAV